MVHLITNKYTQTCTSVRILRSESSSSSSLWVLKRHTGCPPPQACWQRCQQVSSITVLCPYLPWRQETVAIRRQQVTVIKGAKPLIMSDRDNNRSLFHIKAQLLIWRNTVFWDYGYWYLTELKDLVVWRKEPGWGYRRRRAMWCKHNLNYRARGKNIIWECYSLAQYCTGEAGLTSCQDSKWTRADFYIQMCFVYIRTLDIYNTKSNTSQNLWV